VKGSGWIPQEIDPTKPSVARIYDYYLGGSHNFDIDREQARQAIAQWPELPKIMCANRAFVQRAVRFCLTKGVRQFLDIGSGIPTGGNVHEVAQKADPMSRVVYVDIDPVAVAHSQTMLHGNERAVVLQADVRHPDRILNNPRLQRLINFDQPLAVLLTGILLFVPDEDDPHGLVAHYLDAIASGSYLVIVHGGSDAQPERETAHTALYQRSGTPIWLRTRNQITAFFNGTELVEPGLVFTPFWRPDSPVDSDVHTWVHSYGGVGRKP
jgi:S-adenosyl methyltransferase